MSEEGGQRWALAAFDATVDAQGLRREWEEWHRSFELLAEMRNIQSQHEKLVTMLTYGGRGLQRIFYNLKPVPEEVIPGPVKIPLMPPPVPEYDNAIKRLEKFFVGKRNDRVELEVFRSLKQKGEESFNQFVLRLRTQAARCEFGDREETEILQQITMGARDDRVRDKGMESVMNLDDLTSYAINREILMQQRDKLRPFRQEETIAAVNQHMRRSGVRNRDPDGSENWNRRPAGRRDFSRGFKFGERPATGATNRSRTECGRCGSWRHDGNYARCPALGSQCHKCGEPGHFARRCRNDIRQGKTTWRRPPKEVNVLSDEWNEDMPRRPKPEDISKVE